MGRGRVTDETLQYLAQSIHGWASTVGELVDVGVSIEDDIDVRCVVVFGDHDDFIVTLQNCAGSPERFDVGAALAAELERQFRAPDVDNQILMASMIEESVMRHENADPAT